METKQQSRIPSKIFAFLPVLKRSGQHIVVDLFQPVKGFKGLWVPIKKTKTKIKMRGDVSHPDTSKKYETECVTNTGSCLGKCRSTGADCPTQVPAVSFAGGCSPSRYPDATYLMLLVPVLSFGRYPPAPSPFNPFQFTLKEYL
jgi:hypothetical protein